VQKAVGGRPSYVDDWHLEDAGMIRLPRPGQMEEGDVSRERTRHAWFRVGYLVAALPLATAASCAGISVVGRAWNACDAGINASANTLGLLSMLPMLFVAHAVALVFAYMLTGRWISSAAARVGVAALATVVVIALLSWALFTQNGLPMQNASCPQGEPPWWPR
jgi:hypothetical protein